MSSLSSTAEPSRAAPVSHTRLGPCSDVQLWRCRGNHAIVPWLAAHSPPHQRGYLPPDVSPRQPGTGDEERTGHGVRSWSGIATRWSVLAETVTLIQTEEKPPVSLREM